MCTIGHIPKDMYEDELYPLLSKFGELNEIRIMLESGESRGFCFAVYKKREDAQVRKRNRNEFSENDLDFRNKDNLVVPVHNDRDSMHNDWDWALELEW